MPRRPGATIMSRIPTPVESSSPRIGERHDGSAARHLPLPPFLGQTTTPVSLAWASVGEITLGAVGGQADRLERRADTDRMAPRSDWPGRRGGWARAVRAASGRADRVPGSGPPGGGCAGDVRAHHHRVAVPRRDGALGEGGADPIPGADPRHRDRVGRPDRLPVGATPEMVMDPTSGTPSAAPWRSPVPRECLSSSTIDGPNIGHVRPSPIVGRGAK